MSMCFELCPQVLFEPGAYGGKVAVAPGEQLSLYRCFAERLIEINAP